MLKHGKDREALYTDTPVDTTCRTYHQNVRGAHYYNETERLVMHAE